MLPPYGVYAIAGDLYRRVRQTVSPVTTVLYDTYARGSAMLTSLPPPEGASSTVWKFKHFPLFVPKENVEEELKRQAILLDFFVSPTTRMSLDKPREQHYLHAYVLCALHQARVKPATVQHCPHLGLDLIVLYGQRSNHDNFVIEHYRSEFYGAHRDSLFYNAIKVCDKDVEMEERLLEALDNPDSLLHQALRDHRLPISYKALTGTNPDTIRELKHVLTQRIAARQTEDAIPKASSKLYS